MPQNPQGSKTFNTDQQGVTDVKYYRNKGFSAT